MGKLIQLREEMTKVLTDVKAIKSKDDRTPDDETTLDNLLVRANALGPEILREKQIEDAAAQLDDYTKPSNGHQPTMVLGANGTQPQTRDHVRPAAAPALGNFGRRFVGSEQFKDYKDYPRGTSRRYDIGTTYGPLLREAEDLSPDDLEQRTLVYTGGTAGLVPADRQPGTFGPTLLPFQVRARDVLINGRTDSNAVQYVRETGFTNAAAPTAEAVSTATGTKPESAFTFTVVTANVATIAHWIPITRQVIDDAAQMQTYVNSRLIDGLKLIEDQQIIAGDGTGANMTGLNTTSGIGDLNAAYWTANPLPTAGAAANKIDRIRRAKKYVAVTGLAQATFVILHPDDLEQMDELKDSTGDYVIADPVGYNPIPRLWGLVVVESTSQATNTFLVGDGRMAAIFDRMDAQIFMSDSHSDFFIKNIFVLLAEERLALAVYRPAAFAKGILS